MRLKFQNVIPKLKKERIIAKLVGCIHRRLDQKQVLWNNAKYIPLQYNEQRGNIQLFPTKGKRAGDMKYKDLIGRLGKLESILKTGDKGLLTTEEGHRLKLVLAHKEKSSPRMSDEYLYFNAQMQITQVLTKITVEGRDMVNIDDVFSLLDFAFVHLKPKTTSWKA